MRALYDMYSTAYLVPGTWNVLSLAYRGTVRPLYDAYNTAAFFPVYRIVSIIYMSYSIYSTSHIPHNRRFSSAYGARNVYLVHVTVGVFRLLSTMVRSSNIPGYTIQQAFFPLVYATSISHRTRQTLFPLLVYTKYETMYIQYGRRFSPRKVSHSLVSGCVHISSRDGMAYRCTGLSPVSIIDKTSCASVSITQRSFQQRKHVSKHAIHAG